MINIVIVDDEPNALRSLEWEIQNFSSEFSIQATFTEPLEAISYLRKKGTQALFLDIEMPQMDGFTFLEQFPSRDFPVIITTAYDRYAIKAIKESALDYLLKPVDSDDLAQSVAKIKSFWSQKIDASLSISPIQKVKIYHQGKYLFFNPEQIIYIKSDANNCELFFDNNPPLVISQTLKQLEILLPEAVFLRVHNSYIINLNHIKEYHKTEDYIVMSNKKGIPVSRQRKSLVLNRI
ncbi:MAG: LytTR family DNA-binding domain-containing protein [Flavobacteriaceae bacterium]